MTITNVSMKTPSLFCVTIVIETDDTILISDLWDSRDEHAEHPGPADQIGRGFHPCSHIS
jgi:hypothetical protein